MKKRALLIGINDYHLLGKLNFARQDAEATADALCQFCDFSTQDITLMSCHGEGATLGLSNYIEHALMDVAREPDVDMLVFGFWGHGFSPEAGKRYLCGLDTVEHDLERTAVNMDVVKAKLSQAGAKNTLLLLDCCQNKPAGRSASAPSMSAGEEQAFNSMARDISAAHKKDQDISIPTVAILNACREGQKAYEWEQREHGIFTAHLLDGIQQNINSIATLSTWIFDRVSKTANDLYHQKQTPYFTIEGKGDILLSDSSRQDNGVNKKETCTSKQNFKQNNVSSFQHRGNNFGKNTDNKKESMMQIKQVRAEEELRLDIEAREFIQKNAMKLAEIDADDKEMRSMVQMQIQMAEAKHNRETATSHQQSQTTFCSECGSELQVEWKACPSCGTTKFEFY